MNFNYLAISRDIFSKIFLREIRDAYVLKIANLSSNSNSQRLWLPIVQVICHEKWPPLIFFSFTTAVCHWKWSSQKLGWLGCYTQIRNRRAGNNFSPRFTTGPGLINHDEQKKVNSNSLQLQLSFIPGTMLMKKERIFSGCCDGVAPHNGVHECLKSNM